MRIFLFLTILMCISINDISAQSRRSSSRERDKAEFQSLRDRLFVGTYISSPTFAGNTNGSAFGIGVQPFVGYKFNEIISAGLTFKFDYTYFWNFNGSVSFTDFATTTFVRAMFIERLIVQLDGGLYSDQSLVSAFEKERNTFPVLYAGLGWSWGTTEVILAFETLGNLARYQIPVEYKFGFVYQLSSY